MGPLRNLLYTTAMLSLIAAVPVMTDRMVYLRLFMLDEMNVDMSTEYDVIIRIRLMPSELWFFASIP